MVIEQMDDSVPHQQSPADDDGSGRAALAGSTASAGPAGVTGSAGLAGGLARGLAGLVSVDVPGLTTVCLVRHGETDWNVAGRLQGREDTLLNARGREQARLSGRALRRAVCGAGWDLILTSPLRRAAETARIIGDIVAVPRLVAVPELVERDYGAASGLTRAESAARFPDGSVPGEEDRAAVGERSLAALASWVERHPGERILVVTHGGVIGTLLHAASRGALLVAAGSLGNACLNVLHHLDGGWRVVAHNMVDHLA